MLGAIVGDIAGSTREWNNIKSKNFEFLPKRSFFTDDSVMTLAVAQWLVEDSAHETNTLVFSMQDLGRRYPHAGYGNRFRQWLHKDNPEPYNSWGNGSGMRVSPVALYATSLKECLDLAKRFQELRTTILKASKVRRPLLQLHSWQVMGSINLRSKSIYPKPLGMTLIEVSSRYVLPMSLPNLAKVACRKQS